MQRARLLIFFYICSPLGGVVTTQPGDFVTTLEHGHWATGAINTEPNIWHSYRLRFQPVQQLPRIFGHKSQSPHIEESTTETDSVTISMVTTKTESATEEYVEDEESLDTSAEPTVEPTNSIKYPSTMASTTAKPNTSTASDAIYSIMRPPQIGNAIKQMLLHHGSPFHLKLWQRKTNGNKTKSKGFLSLFEVIKFENTKCSLAMDGGEIDVRLRALEGICYHEFECKNLGGIPTEPCADGVGVCCVFLVGCGDTSKESVVYFESPNYPNPVHEMLICVLILNLRDAVQQLRLDFVMFELNRPTDGNCVDDQFIVSGHSINFAVPLLCGINTGQHLYIDVANSFEKKIYVSFITKVVTGERSFNIKIMQLDDNLAPEGCLQYYTENEGVVKSFNYDSLGTFVNIDEPTYLNNLNYAICLKRSKDMCSVTYTNGEISSEQPNFQIVNKDEEEGDLVPDGQAGAGIFNCPDDYIAINQVRLCGERLNDGTTSDDFTQNAPVKDVAAGPIILPVRTDDEYVGRGFRLNYKQELCA